MRICVLGAGAVGGFIGTQLAAAGADVCALARGATLAALRAHGWQAESAGRRVTAAARAAADPAELGEQDVVILAVIPRPPQLRSSGRCSDRGRWY